MQSRSDADALSKPKPYAGAIAKQEEFHLQETASGFEREFEWNSTGNNPEQELTVQFSTSDLEAPTLLLADPISRRRNFLISFSTDQEP